MKATKFSLERIQFIANFVLQNQSTLYTQIIQFGVWNQNGQTDLFPLFTHTFSDIKNLNFKVYDFKLNKYFDIKSFGNRSSVPTSILENSHHIILIKYNTNQSETLSFNSYENSIHHGIRSEICTKKSQRSKQRTIVQVIQIVKKWRNLHENKNGTPISLPAAAQLLGLPKKSLDDYFYQLRMGEKYGFDYHSHMMEGIGVLRTFLKRFKSQRKGDKNQKLPSILRISNQIEKYENMSMKQDWGNLDRQYSGMIQEEKKEKEEIKISYRNQKQQIEQSFYNEFNYDFNRQIDPFVNLDKGSENKNILNLGMGLGRSFDIFQE